MKRNTTSFAAGLVTGAMLLSLGTTALAASGKVQFDFSNVALNGERKITAGEEITAPNGQKIPGTILYVDEAGGKTNYLPIRAVSELLGVEIGYDTDTKTVLLGKQPSAERPHWKKTVDGTQLSYVGTREDSPTYETAAAVKVTFQAKDFGLEELRTTRRKDLTAYRYHLGAGRIQVDCLRPSSGSVGVQFRDEDAIKHMKQVTVQGRPAELYAEEERTVLVWQPNAELLCWMTGLGVPEEQLVQVAESLRLDTEQANAYTLGWMPAGSSLQEAFTAGGGVFQTYGSPSGSFTLLATPSPAAVPQGPAEQVELFGRSASYWEAKEQGKRTETSVQELGNVVIAHSGYSGSRGADASVLAWSDPDTGMNFRLVGELSRSDLLRIAENLR